MNKFRTAYYVIRFLGPGFVASRLRIKLRAKLPGIHRKFHPRAWSDIDRELHDDRSDAEYAEFKTRQAIPFFFPLGEPPSPNASREWNKVRPRTEFAQPLEQSFPDTVACHTPQDRRPSLAQRIELLREMRLVYFLERVSPTPVDWYQNPFDGRKGHRDVPWYLIPDFGPQQGDVRTLWEGSRAAWAIDLARGSAQCEGERAGELAELYWKLVDSWMDACPPWTGFQWKCGQEASVRFLALAIGFWSFAKSSSTTPARWRQFARLAWATGYRVFHHIDYALSQKNNHALSEACGLMLVAHLFPEFREAEKWTAKGREIFERELPRQIYDDGSYIQHSMNYHRVMLHVSIVAFRLAELGGRPFDRSLCERLGKAGEFLLAMMDPQTGHVPMYGNNDGSCVLPLNECAFWDFRPVIAATHFLVHRKRLFEPGPWDEDAAWLFGNEQRAPANQLPDYHITKLPNQASRGFDAGGYYTLRQANSWAMVRCHTYRDRPSQCDPLHVDLWWRGLNVLRDCGTFQYYAPGRPDLEEYFASLAAHNTIEIKGAAPYERVTRFLWFPWPRAKVTGFSGLPDRLYFQGERVDGKSRLASVVHRRTVTKCGHNAWVIIDDLLGSGLHTAVLRWHFLDAPCTLDARTQAVEFQTGQGLVSMVVHVHGSKPVRFEVIRGRNEVNRVQGFAADQYAQLDSIPVLEVEFADQLPIRVVSMLGLGRRIEAADIPEGFSSPGGMGSMPPGPNG